MPEASRTSTGLYEWWSELREQALASPWLSRLALLGYASKGLIYLLVGALALQVALGAQRERAGLRAALHVIVRQPFGTILLVVVALGLGTYALWRLVQAALDPENHGTDTLGMAKRGAYAASGVAFASVAWEGLEIIVGWGTGELSAAEDWTKFILAQPLGRWLVAVGGCAVIGAALYQLYEALTARFRRKFRLDEMSRLKQTWLTSVGRLALAARGIIFGTVGGFLIVAAIQANAEHAMGLGEAVASLDRRPFGPWLLAALALGLIAYGIYTLAEARYRRFFAPGGEQ